MTIEVVAITAFEARDLPSLQRPSVCIAYIVFILFILAVIGEVLTVSWLDGNLPKIYGDVNTHLVLHPRTRTIISTAALEAHYPNTSGTLSSTVPCSIQPKRR